MTGVGIIGAGPGVSALHLPTLARLEGRFEVVHISDSGSGRAAALAARNGARWSRGTHRLLADPRVDVVLIASPPQHHAEHALAAISAGKRGILCEKPLALTTAEADAVVDAARCADVALVVGTNHLFDPAWGRAKHHAAAGGRVQSISITASLPPNSRYHDLVTEQMPPAAPRSAPDPTDPRAAAEAMRQLVLGLLVHDLPLVRDLAPGEPEVLFARLLAPIGCAVGFRVGDVVVQASAVMVPDGADALWRMSVATTIDQFEVAFPPSFVHGGSSRVQASGEQAREVSYQQHPDNGYLAEWHALAAALDGAAPIEYDELRADARFAIRVADGAVAALLGKARA